MGVETTRTTILPLTLPREETERVLHATAGQYYWCHNQTTKRAVRDDIYDRLKSRTGGLNANLVQAAIKQTVENVDALQTKWENGERISQPEYTTDDGWTLHFDKRWANFHKYGLELSLVDGEVTRRAWPQPAGQSSPTSPALKEASGSADPERSRPG